jgi:LysM repeat protein
MRYAAITAAVFGGAMFLAVGSHAPLSDARQFSNIINNPSAQTVQTVSKHWTKKPANPANLIARQQTVEAAKPANPVLVTVAPGDNLTKLAEANGTSYQRIYNANPSIDNPNLIQPGQELKVPTPDEQLATRVLPVPAPVAVPVATAAPAAPRPVATSSAPTVADGSVWDRLAVCESGGNWAINTGNGFYGGLQFTLASWQAVGGTGMPNEASREEQILRGQILQARGGWGNWPACTARLGIS